MGMWWEIVPVFGICMGLAALPVWLQHGLQKVVYGNMYNRNLTRFHDFALYQRDRDKSDPSLLSLSKRYYNKGTGSGEGNIHKTHGLEKYE
jgi:hypothetical protein